ncbi:MAG: hypothetical protein F6J93_07835 [Oscillatoria sp. SIO1A7]|nr:hypothetical protein [Oscillatoria sp. SIO1A7]
MNNFAFFFRRRSRPYAPEGGLRLRGLPDARCPMPDAQCPMPNSQFRSSQFRSSQCPMPNAQCPMPNSQF